ncbi:hypothetical protein SAMN00777080_1552 [Aquiflexum balticum DSM 16537]|uniref:Uncharacterized protein n=1 Tax=Aquiflexum balticum DSM 16537 TaxID=758820 RepID=A0A1W2H273_9BACT|nr:hypothetical protein [Aquiflexum balticum]SMD42981.1 hypothetical protein SAMN00777080_1552 [Aquiflexum balticum DSM 16537]
MNFKSTLLLLLAFFLAINSCKDTEEPNLPVNGDSDIKNVPTLDVSIIIPDGTTLDLSGSKVLANTFDFAVNESKKSKIALQPGQTQLAFLLDKDENVLLSGFINEAKKEISVASSAEVLLYYGSGAFILPFEFRERYLDKVSELAVFDQFTQDLELAFKQNPSAFSNGSFRPILNAALEEIVKDIEPLDIKARQINFEPNGIQSGIQVFDNDFQSVYLRNYYRRKAHAFLYKTAFKNKEGIETILKEAIASGDITDVQQPVDATKSVSGFLGTLSDGLAGQGIQYAKTDSPPINVPLGENELEATYELRVIGPSLGINLDLLQLTSKEKEKWEDLMIETLFMDIVIPLMSEVFSAAGDMATEEHSKIIAAAVKNVADFTPFYKELYQTKDLTKFVSDIMDYFISDKVNSDFQEVIADLMTERAMQNGSWEVDLNAKYREEMKKARFLKVLKYIDLAIKGADFSKMIGEISSSSAMEKFKVKAVAHDITLSPKEASIVTFSNQELTVNTKTQLGDGEAFLYKWSTPGKYGKIRDNLGNNGTEFENGQKTITYRAETQSSNLPDDAVEEVMVTAYVKQGSNLTKIGETKALITIKPARLEVKPKNVTLSGKEKQKVKLYVEWANGDAFYKANDPTFDYKFEWITDGLYGNFEGGLRSVTTLVPYLSYQALDEDVKSATEKVKVKAYLKSKDSNNWTLYDDIEGSVQVENDELKKVIYVNLTPRPWGPTVVGNYTNCGASTLFLIPPYENAVSYSATIISFSPRLNPHPEGTTRTWQENPALLKDGFYEFAERSAGAVSSPTWLFNAGDCSPYIANANSRRGIAKVVITLKKP